MVSSLSAYEIYKSIQGYGSDFSDERGSHGQVLDRSVDLFIDTQSLKLLPLETLQNSNAYRLA